MRITIYLRQLFLVISVLITVISLSSTVVACECEIPIPCVAFSQAEAVFIGKAQEIVTDKDEFLESVEVKFEVEKIYKGIIAKYKVVKFSAGDCSIKFQKGDRYFVYENRNNNIATNYCNRTGLFERSKEDIEYADRFSETKPMYSVNGRIIGLSKMELLNSLVSIEEGDNNNRILLDELGEFRFDTFQKGSLKVKIVIPFKGNVLADNILVSTTSCQTSIEYILNLRPNECDFKEIEVLKN